MRFERLSLRSIGTFASVDVDFAALPRLVAVTGVNGAGKSTLLEMLMGALDRKCPTRGSLLSLATARDAFVDVAVTAGGRSYVLRHRLDAVGGKAESVVLNGTGESVGETTTGKVSSFDAWRRRELPSADVLLNSIFMGQGSSGFLSLTPGERKAIVLRVLGIERYEALAERARKEAAAALAKASGLQAAADMLRRNAPELDLAVAAQAARERLGKAVIELDAARTRVVETQALDHADEQRQAKRQELVGLATMLRESVLTFSRTVERCRSLVARADEIRAASSRRDSLVVELANAEARVAAIGDQRVVDAQLAHDIQSKRDVAARTTTVQTRLATAHRTAAQRRSVDQAVADDRLLRVEIAEVTAQKEAIDEECRTLSSRRLASDSHRIGNLRGGLETIVELEPRLDDYAAQNLARATLEHDTRAAEDHERAPAKIRILEERRNGLYVDGRMLREKLDATGKLTALVDTIDQAEQDIVTYTNELADLAVASETAGVAVIEAAARRDALVRERSLAAADLRRVRSEMDVASFQTSSVEELARAEATLAATEPRLLEDEKALGKAEEQLASMPDSLTAEERRRRSFAAAAASAERLHEEQGARHLLARAEAAIEEDGRREARLSELGVALSAVAVEEADWVRLTADLGRNGLQALEIDAAGPELTEIANDLLHQAFGPRFTLRFDTTRAGASGGTIEVFDVVVLDSERGREGNAETLSGGERVIVGEAVSLALTLLACHRGGLAAPTLVRDESGAALDVENGPRYVAMLRRAADLVGASQVLFVTHAPDVQALADARLVVENGTVRTE